MKFLPKKINIKYVAWIVGVIIWNYGFPIVPPSYDVVMAILLKHVLAQINSLQFKYLEGFLKDEKINMKLIVIN